MSQKTQRRYLLLLIPLLVNILLVAGGLALAPTKVRADSSETKLAVIPSEASAITPGNIALAVPPTPSPEEFSEDISEDQATVDAQLSTSLQSSHPASPLVTPTIYLKSRQFQPSTMDALDAQSLQRLASQGQDRIHILVQLDFIPRETARAELAARGLKLLAYVPDYAWIASVPVSNPDAALELTGVTWAGELTVDDKLDPAIKSDAWGSWNLAPDGVAAVYVAMHKDESLETGRWLAEAHGGQVTGEVIGINMLIVEIPRDNIRALAAEDAVQWIEPAAPPLGEANDGIRDQIGVDTLQAAPYNLDGTGIDVMVYDGGQVGTHMDFGARLTVGAGDSSGVSEHATHVAGTVGGDGSNSAAQGGSALQWRGMATNVDIISYGYEWDTTGILFYSNPGDIEQDWAWGQNSYGADLGTASLGSNIYANYYPTYCYLMGNYGQTSVLMDQIVRGGNSVVGIGDKYIATWAAGNERGWATTCDTTGYNNVAPPAGAKNPIHVGGSNTNNNTQYAHTSWGPTDDGRIKPIVTAGACQTSGDGGIKSTDNSPLNAYTVKCGTSMATPAVAGGIALMLQHYRDVYNTSGNFWSSTAKAILMQTADDLGNPGPDYQWGYGQVDIHTAVDLISREAFRQESIAQGEVDVYYFIVPDDATPATVSLAWDDYEATVNANPTLINNLDLELVAPDGTIWRPWALDPANPANNATRGVDNRNNQEQVQVFAADEDIVGTWLVRVKGTSVPQGPQDYSLVCEGCQPLNVGVCQSEISGAATAATSLSDAEDSMLDENGAGDELLSVPTLHDEPSAGELWQRALEAQSAAGVAAQTIEREAEIQTALTAFETAREDGPEAVVALLDTLRGEALDLVMDEIVEAQEQLAEKAPPPPETGPVSQAEEMAALEAQQAVEAANRAQALALRNDPFEGQTQISESANQPAYPNRPTADLTVGNGCTYATIASAISTAIPGDRLLIEGGVTFVENLTIPISLTLQGGYNGCASGSTARTTVDGNASGRVFEIHSGLDITLENLNITNGDTGLDGGGVRFAAGAGAGSLNLAHVNIYGNAAEWGGGLWVGMDAEVVGTDVEIYDNTATTAGGGVRLYGGRTTFSGGSNIRNNTAPLGGGVAGMLRSGYAPLLNLPSSADVYLNQSLTGDGFGSGVYMSEGTISLADCSDIYSNAAIAGGGAYLITSTLTINGSCSEIQNNTATGDGGGVYAQGSTINLDDQADLYSNDAGTDGSGSGGGAYLDNSDLWSDRASIRYNTADDFGGGVYATNGSRVDMDIDTYTCLGARCSRLSNNTATNTYGGGVYANDSTVDLRNTFVENNTAGYGGGVYAYQSTVTVYNNLFAENNATGGTGDGLRLYTGSSMSGNGNTLADNDTSTGQAIGISGANLTLGCSIIWGHASSINLVGQNVSYSDIQGGYAGTGNLSMNPLFVNPAADDYHLQSTSPVIDRCVSGTSPDFDNERRPIVRTTAASPYDMGADEAAGVERVGVNGAGCAYATIQQAVNAASDGDTLQVAAGVYFENVDIDGSQIVTIEGGYDSTCTAAGSGATRIEGSAASGSTFDIYNNATVTLRDLQIAWGSGSGGGVDASNDARVTLDNSDVFNNHGSSGGGIYVSSSSAMTLTNDSDVRDNTASGSGGGVRVWGQFFGGDNASDIYENCAPDGGGFYVPGGTLSLNAADVYLNEAAATDGKGGGIYVTSGGNITLTNSAYVYYLNEAYDGAGIYADDATVYMQGATTTIRDNVAENNGGGIYLTNNSTLRSDGARIGQPGSTIANEALRGAGIYAFASTVDFDGGYIINNIASSQGAGIYADASIINLTNTHVGGTGDYEANQLGSSSSFGAGLYLANGTQATLSNSIVSSNTFIAAVNAGGGGAYVTSGSTLTLTNNSRVERHVAAGTSLGRGAGIYADHSTVTLDNSQVVSNTASTNGGGLRLYNSSTLNVLNGSSISNNETLNDEGGGIAATGISTITISNSTLQDNTAGTNGGAIYAEGNSLVQCDGAEFGASNTGNRAMAGSGGALYLSVSTLDAANCTFRNGQATENGGAIAAYASTLTIDADYTACDPLSGQCSTFYSNTADSDDTNSSSDYGGAIYVEDSALQMNRTYLHRNSAWRGGAIYQLGASASSQVNNTIFYSNTVDSSTGAAIRVSQGSFTVTHVTLVDNPGSAPAYSAAGGTSNAAHNSIAWGNSNGGFEGPFAIITSCNIDQSGNVGVAVDPQFVGPGVGENYHLLGSSPAINACTTGLSPDLDDILRPFGSGYDMGAYEYASGIEFTPDNSGSGIPASAVSYVHTLTNSGAGADTFTLAASSSQGWIVTINPAPTVMLESGQSTPVTVTINIPAGTPNDTVDTTVVTASSSADPTLAASVTDATTVTSHPDIVVTPLALNVTLDSGDTVNRTLTIQNTGTADLTWSLAESPTRAWLSENPVSGTITPAGSASVEVTFTATGLASGVYTTVLQITSNDPDEPQVNVPVTLTVHRYDIYLPLVVR